MIPLAVWKLRVTASDGVQLSARTPLTVHHDSEVAKYYVPLGAGRIFVGPAAGMTVGHAGMRWSHFLPMFDCYGVFQGLVPGEKPVRHGQKASAFLLVIEGRSNELCITHSGHQVHYCGTRVLDTDGELHGHVLVLRSGEQVTFSADGRRYRYFNDSGELVPIC